MPGKHGFGDTRKKSSQSPAYKKQKFGARSPFTMKGSPYKQKRPMTRDILQRGYERTYGTREAPSVHGPQLIDKGEYGMG